MDSWCLKHAQYTLKGYFQYEKKGLLKKGTGERMQYWTDVSIQRICYLAALPFWTNQCNHAKQRLQAAILNKPVQNNQKQPIRRLLFFYTQFIQLLLSGIKGTKIDWVNFASGNVSSADERGHLFSKYHLSFSSNSITMALFCFVNIAPNLKRCSSKFPFLVWKVWGKFNCLVLQTFQRETSIKEKFIEFFCILLFIVSIIICILFMVTFWEEGK